MLSSLLRIYRTHLSRYLIFRLIRFWAEASYRFTYRLFSALVSPVLGNRYSLVNFSCFSGANLKNRFSFAAAQSIEIPAPRFINGRFPMHVERLGSFKTEMSKLEIVEIRDAVVVGGADFVLAGNAAVWPDAFVASRDTCPAEIFGVISINRRKNMMGLHLTRGARQFDRAIMLMGQNTANYAHWLTETLPKLVTLNSYPEFDHLPLLVDSGLHPNIYESIELLNSKHRDVVLVKRWEPVILDEIVCVSQPAYEPYVPQGLFNEGSSSTINAFSRPALDILRKAATGAVSKSGRSEMQMVYFCRSEQSRNLRGIINSEAIEEYVRAVGFELVEPASLGFMQQVAACSQARIIVAPIGAALANMIFAPRGCKILTLAPYYDGANYYYYSNLAGVLGHELHYVLGQQIDKGEHPMHRRYSIDLSDLKVAIELCAGARLTS